MAENDMGMEIKVERPNRSNSGRADAVVLLAFTILGFLIGWVVVEYLHNVYLQQYLNSIIHPPSSVLRPALPLGALLVGVAVLLRGRRKRRLQSTLERNVSLSGSTYEHTIAHPLFLYERPARDSQFVVRKTRTPGRISRIREAERLPPGDLA